MRVVRGKPDALEVIPAHVILVAVPQVCLHDAAVAADRDVPGTLFTQMDDEPAVRLDVREVIKRQVFHVFSTDVFQVPEKHLQVSLIQAQRFGGTVDRPAADEHFIGFLYIHFQALRSSVSSGNHSQILPLSPHPEA